MENRDSTLIEETKESLPSYLVNDKSLRASNLKVNLLSKLNRFVSSDVHSNYKWPKRLTALRIRPTNLRSLPKALLSITEFSTYHTCQVLIHEKGTSHAITHFYDISGNARSFHFPVDIFNHLFNLIRKSKHKLFDQSHIQSSYLQLLGPFLAKSISIKAYNIAIVISRNELLMPIPSEISVFDQIMEPMPLLLSNLLLKESYSRRISFFRKCVFEFPTQLKIADCMGICKFKNKAILRTECLKGVDEFKLKTKKLTNGVSLFFRDCEYDFISAFDYFHKQRISLLGELFNTLRHELSNPLFGLKLACDLMQLNKVDEEFDKLMAEISLNVNKCQDIINGFSKLYNHESSIQSINVFTIVHEAFILAKSEMRLIKKKVISNDHNPNIPLYVKANSTWAIQILFNLLVNSSQAMREATELREQEITLEVKLIAELQRVEILITDNGPGISEEVKNKLFSPFFTTKPYGTGLGLAISRNLASQLGGDLNFYNNYSGRGVTFKLALPLGIQ